MFLAWLLLAMPLVLQQASADPQSSLSLPPEFSARLQVEYTLADRQLAHGSGVLYVSKSLQSMRQELDLRTANSTLSSGVLQRGACRFDRRSRSPDACLVLHYDTQHLLDWWRLPQDAKLVGDSDDVDVQRWESERLGAVVEVRVLADELVPVRYQDKHVRVEFVDVRVGPLEAGVFEVPASWGCGDESRCEAQKVAARASPPRPTPVPWGSAYVKESGKSMYLTGYMAVDLVNRKLFWQDKKNIYKSRNTVYIGDCRYIYDERTKQCSMARKSFSAATDLPADATFQGSTTVDGKWCQVWASEDADQVWYFTQGDWGAYVPRIETKGRITDFTSWSFKPPSANKFKIRTSWGCGACPSSKTEQSRPVSHFAGITRLVGRLLHQHAPLAP